MKALTVSEQDNTSLYKIDQLSAMTWIQNTRSELNPAIISNCWTKTGLSGVRTRSSNELQNSIVRDEQEILDYIRSILSVQQQIVMENFIEPADENYGTTEN